MLKYGTRKFLLHCINYVLVESWDDFQEKGMQQSLRNIMIQAAAYDSVIKRTVIPIQYTKKEFMAILNKKKARLVNKETSMSKPDSSSGI